MALSSSMLEEVHGDTCRLGYLKLLSCLADDFQPYSQEYFSSRLYSLTKDHYKDWTFPSELSSTGLITEKQGLTISRNYVNLAYEFGVLNKTHQTLGPFGRIYSKTESSKKVREYIQNHDSRSENILILNDFERVLFLNQLFEVDGLAIFNILKWICEQENVSRKVAMIYFMEEIYPQTRYVLSESTTDYLKKLKLKEEAERAKGFKEERLRHEKEGNWGNSPLYAKYRHMAPPRFEWLIDLGILEKKGRGNYTNTSVCQKVYNVVSGKTLETFRNEAFYELGKIYKEGVKEASIDEIKSLLVDCYMKFERAGHLAVDRLILEKLVAFQLLETVGKTAKLSTIDNVIETLHQQDSKLVQYHVDLTGNWRFVKISKDILRR